MKKIKINNFIIIKKSINIYMSDINKIIKDNYKINEDTLVKNDEINTINNQGPDSSFNQLLALQLLIRKHSGLKELCK